MYSLSSQPSEANPGFLAKKETEQASQGQTNFKDATSSELQNIHELQSLIEESSFDSLIRNSNTSNHDATANLSFLLWEKYIDAVRCDMACTDALSQNEVKDGDFSMRFDIKTKGEKPTEGYPLYIALHGGGGCSASTNDSQWEHMKIYYYDSMDIGIYVAPRGITNNWNLHFEDASYRLYDKLIKYLIACHDVDPNRVYLLGFSAGGDGVYQVVPRMADLWAGANMSAGHSNGVKFDNLYQTPFLIQMGECDKAYNRHKVAVENSIELRRLQKARGGYEHEIFLHCEGTHNNWSDRDASGKARPIVTNIEDWLSEAESEVSHCNTAAVHWLKKYKRNPHPTKLVWDPNTNAPRHVKNGAVYLNDEDTKSSLVVPRHLFYWLNIGHNPKLNENFVIEAALDASSNTVEFKSLGSLDYISVLLNNKMLDLERPIRVIVDEKDIGSAIVKADLKIMARTLLERGDIHYMFSSEIVITKGDDGIWKILQD